MDVDLKRLAALVACVSLVAAAVGCTRLPERLGPEETFHWVAQPITFAPPPAPRWERQGENSGGMLGVRFILRGGGGQVMGVAAFRLFAERKREDAIARLLARRDSLSQREFVRELSLARARTDDPISEREAAAARAINTALDQAMAASFAGDQPAWVAHHLETALRAAHEYEPTLEEILPRVRLQPERMQEPERWRIGRERDTTLAGLPAFASDDTLITDERPLLYHEVFWVVRGYAFKAAYQGTAENLDTFHRMVESIRFPDSGGTAYAAP